MMVLVRGDMDKDIDGRWVRVGDILSAAGITVTGTPLSELSVENAQLRRRFDSACKDMVIAEKAIADLKADIAFASEKIDELKAENASLVAARQERDEWLAERDQEVAQLLVEIDRLKAALERTLHELAQVGNLKTELRERTVEIDCLKAENARLESVRQNRDSLLAASDRKIAQLLATLESIRYHATNAV